MSYFNVKTKIFMGLSAFDGLKELNIKNACIITDPFVVKSGMINRLTDALKECDIEYRIFSDIVPDPPAEIVVEGARRIMEHSPDAVIAMGGGSAIDAAKAISYIYQQTAQVKKPICIAIPTTSGTGSEVTSFSVITDSKNNVKYPIVDEKLLPNVAILDPSLTISVPPSITADTGFDVLTHALEAYVSNKANDFTNALAEKAITGVVKYLPVVYTNGGDVYAREKIHNASTMAGIAFDHASLGINHSLAHAIGAKFHISHGRSNAIVLPYVIAFNAGVLFPTYLDCSRSVRRYSRIAGYLGISGMSTIQTVRHFINDIEALKEQFNIPKCIKDAGVSESDYKQAREAIAEAAKDDKCTLTNPRKPSISELENLLDMCYYGTNII